MSILKFKLIIVLFISVFCGCGKEGSIGGIPFEQWISLGLENETVTAIAVHPIDPSILYVGTSSDFSAGISGKLFKSTNYGRKWDTLMVGDQFTAVALDPLNPEIVYTNPYGLLKSTNGGKSWLQITTGIYIDGETCVQSFSISPCNTNKLYTGTGGVFGGRFYKSINGGENWIAISPDIISSSVVSIAIDPNDSNVIYVGTDWTGSLWKTTNGGDTWILTGLGQTHQIIQDILIHPNESRIVYAGITNMGVWKTEDAGKTWNSYNNGLPDNVHGMKIVMRRRSLDLFLVGSFGDIGWIYRKSNDIEPWVKFGINELRKSYYYSDIMLSKQEDIIYFGNQGIYCYKFR